MKANKSGTIYFVLYIIAAAIIAVVYFSVPERKAFLEYQAEWWGQMWDVVIDGAGDEGIGSKK